MRLKLYACEVFHREMCYATALSPNMIDIEFIPKGLHDIGAKGMLERLQAILDATVEADYDAIVMGYGLCNNGLAGLTARSIPVVVPRAHDCITLFLGSKERYLEYFNSHPGVYFKTSGWMERGAATGDLSQLTVQRMNGMDREYQELVEKYGEENAKYLYEVLNMTHNYGQFTFIEMGIEPNDSFEEGTRKEAEERGWKFEKEAGDLSMIRRLTDGPWDDREFLVVPPGHRVIAQFDEGILASEAAT